MERFNLTQMKSGEQGTVSQIIGGFGMQRRVESLGVRIGVNIKKISSQFMRGPVTVQVGNTQVALGFGMAQKIIVEKI
ncbi:MAG: ferrous iron transport protein A [Candidatus Cloacimonetes bacterium]|nr:ferrous iron transport protein A [Candidatus Cloacimonadota bacterium]